ncbi:ABC transporter ATP-binding protein [Rhodopseudomonas palustris]|uniref:ABC transporter related n=1 Tax=Rhodopseudomonas palustris (strain BisB18) TaxID=316056 RepID=Q212U9_RHOPB
MNAKTPQLASSQPESFTRNADLDADAVPRSALRALLVAQAPLLATAGVLSLLCGVLELLPYWLIYRMVIILIGPQPDLGSLMIFATAMLAATGARFLIGGTSLLASHAAAFRVSRRLRHVLVAKIAELPIGALEGRAGDYKKAIVDDPGGLEGLISHTYPDAITGLSTTVLGAIFLLTIDWRMTLVSLALIPVSVYAQFRIFGSYAENVTRWHAAEAAANSGLMAYVSGLATLKAFNRTATTLDQLRGSIHALAELAATMTRRSAGAYAVFTISLSTNLLVVLPVGVAFLLNGMLDAPTLVLFSLLGAALTAPLLKLLIAMSSFERQRQGWTRIATLLEQRPLPRSNEPVLPARFDIAFKAVSFDYGEKLALRDVTFHCPAGRVTALVGPSGAGKSTLLALLARFQETGSGCIQIGGVDIRRISDTNLQSLLATVFQRPYFFTGSIDENLRVASPAAGVDAIERALSAVNLSDVFKRSSLGTATSIADSSARLSGGERQRLAIARAAIKNAPILLLDEATAFVDPENELSIQHALSQLAVGRTVLVVAHRLSTIVEADQIVVLNAGRVEACGTHEELLTSSATYRRLWAAQSRASTWRLRSSEREDFEYDR